MEERELVILLLSVAVLGLALHTRARMYAIPGVQLLYLSACAWILGYVITVAEGLLPAPLLLVDVAEHGSYLLSCLMLVGWIAQHWGREPQP